MTAPSSRRSAVDWGLLMLPLLRLAIAAAVGGAIAAASGYYAHSAAVERASQESRFDAARDGYRRAVEARENLERYAERYRYWRERGVIGGERRLQWIETLQNAATSLRLPEVRYTVAPRAVGPELRTESPSPIYRTEMTLSLELLHEGDLLDLTSQLERDALGLFRIRACELIRGRVSDEAAPSGRLAGQCRLEWLTVGEDTMHTGEAAENG